ADLRPHERRALGGGVNRQAVRRGYLGKRHDGLERRVNHLPGAERVLEHLIGFSKSPGDVAAADSRVERNVGSRPPAQILEIGERSGRLQHVMHDRCVRTGGCDFVEHGSERLVLDFDQICGLLGDVRIGRKRDRDRLADVTNLVDRQDRLVVKGRTVVGVRHERRDIGGGDDGVYAFKCERGASIDAHDTSVRDRAAVNLAVQHARKSQVVDVFDRAVDLGGPFEAWDGASDLTQRADSGGVRGFRWCCHRGGRGRHGFGPDPSRIAWSSARRTCTRTISRLYAAVPRMSVSGSTSAAAASAAAAKIAGPGGLPTRARSAPAIRIGRSVAALTAIRASAIRSPSERYQTATPTAGQSSADSAVNFAYQARTPGGCTGISTSAINSPGPTAVW